MRSAGHTCDVGTPGEAPHMSRRRLFIAEKNLMMFISGQKPFYCKQMPQPVGRFWRQGYGPLPPNFSSQELSPKALKCNTSPCCLLQAPHWSAEASDWPILWPGNVQAQCSAAHFILKGYQSYQNKSSQKLIKICCSLNGVTASQLSDHFWF